MSYTKVSFSQSITDLSLQRCIRIDNNITVPSFIFLSPFKCIWLHLATSLIKASLQIILTIINLSINQSPVGVSDLFSALIRILMLTYGICVFIRMYIILCKLLPA